MSLRLTEKESLKLQRSVGSQNSEYKTALTPTESGEYILRSQKAELLIKKSLNTEFRTNFKNG